MDQDFLYFIHFLGWLKKHHGWQNLKKCQVRWRDLDIRSLVLKYGEGHIFIDRTAVKLEKSAWTWADAILIKYDEEIPPGTKRGHHGGKITWR